MCCSLSPLCADHDKKTALWSDGLGRAARDCMGTFHQRMHLFLGPFIGSSDGNVFNCSSWGNINWAPWERDFFLFHANKRKLRFCMLIQSLRKKCSHYFYLSNKYFIVFACLSEIGLRSVHRLALKSGASCLRLSSAKMTSSHPFLFLKKKKKKASQNWIELPALASFILSYGITKELTAAIIEKHLLPFDSSRFLLPRKQCFLLARGTQCPHHIQLGILR